MNALNALPNPEPHQRKIVYRDGSVGLVELKPTDPPEPFIRLVIDNHWYRWNQKLGAYKWHSYRKPKAVRAEETAQRDLIVCGAVALALVVGILILLQWLGWLSL